MAKGSASKETIIAKIFEVFPDAFMDGKDLRIPMVEDGAEVQIKCSFTCAKTNVERGGASAVAGAIPAVAGAIPTAAVTINQPVEPTAEEKKTLSEMMQMLGLG